MTTDRATTRALMVPVLAMALSAGTCSAQGIDAFVWPEVPSQREAVPAAFAGAPLVLLTELTHFLSRLEPGPSGTTIGSSAEVHGVVRVMNEQGLIALGSSGVPIQGVPSIALCRVRIMHDDGSVVEPPERFVRLTRPVDPEEDAIRLRIDTGAMRVGDELEFVVRSAQRAPLRSDALYLHGELPILHKEITIDVASSIAPLIRTFNGFPPHEVDPVGAVDRRRSGPRLAPEMDRLRWRAELLPAVQSDPLLLKRDCRPFLRLGSAAEDLRTQTIRAQRAFDATYPHITAHGRAHENDFTRFVESVRARHPYGSIHTPIAEVVRFLNDSMRIVDEDAMSSDLSIGEYFHARRIPASKLVSLYRSIFIIFDIPFHVGYARSAYLEQMELGTPDISGATHQLLAFRDERTTALHVISPGTTRGAWLLDEVPPEIAGATATFFKFRPGLLPPQEVFTHALPAPRIADHGRVERRSVHVDADGRVVHTLLSGTLIGYPAAIAEHRELPGPGNPIEARLAPWFAVPIAAQRMRASRSSSVARAYSYELPQKNTEAGTSLNATTFRLRDLFQLPFIDAPPPDDTCGSYLPFPFAVRATIVIDATSFRARSFVAPPDAALENEAGSFRLIIEQLADRIHVAHVEFVSSSTVVDRSMQEPMQRLVRTALESLDAPLFSGP